MLLIHYVDSPQRPVTDMPVGFKTYVLNSDTLELDVHQKQPDGTWVKIEKEVLPVPCLMTDQ